MVIAGVVLDEKSEKELKKLGVKDSKQLSPKRREVLAEEIEKRARNIVVIRVPACKIDSYRAKKINLDRIEAIKMADIINVCNADKFYIDSLGVNTNRFKNMIVEYLQNKNPDMVVENYADDNYTVVGAASIIAKTSRDEVIAQIEREVGEPIGVGYSHDSRTVKLVEGLVRSGKKLPVWVRKSWVTTQVIQENSLQRRLKDFIKKKIKI
jgi:ribonuclease HII